ncbi:MAG TPA: DUF6027 family protein [Dehalococcoidia bacterium]|jgi:hypothetical protein
MHDDAPLIRLEPWSGPWPEDDPDANFKTDVALYSLLDPLSTLRTLSRNTGIPLGALCRYVLARWAAGGSEGLLELGPSTVGRMWQACVAAEAEGTDAARLRAYEQLRQMLGWLRAGAGTEA